MTDHHAGVDPVGELENSAWVLAAVVAAQRELAAGELPAALATDPERAAVLEAAGFVARSPDGFVATARLGDPAVAANAAAARAGSLAQALAAATGGPAGGWDAQPDDVLLDQGRASAATGRALATRVAPGLPGLAERLATPGSRVLDIGTGVGALALALARELPQVRVTGIDNLERAVRLAGRELERAGAESARVRVLRQDVTSLREPRTYDLIWLPAPFLTASALGDALPHVVDALAPGGWLVVGTNPAPAGALAAALARWQAARNDGSAVDAPAMAALLTEHGLDLVDQRPTVPGGPVLVVGRRADAALSWR